VIQNGKPSSEESSYCSSTSASAPARSPRKAWIQAAKPRAKTRPPWSPLRAASADPRTTGMVAPGVPITLFVTFAAACRFQGQSSRDLRNLTRGSLE